MGPGKKETKRKPPTKKTTDSWVDKITGIHTNTVIAFILFIVVLIPLIIVMFIDDSLRKEILTVLLTLLSAFGGFIVGDKQSTKK